MVNENTGTENPGTENHGTVNHWTDNLGRENSGAENPRADNLRTGNSGTKILGTGHLRVGNLRTEFQDRASRKSESCENKSNNKGKSDEKTSTCFKKLCIIKVNQTLGKNVMS